jgi:hypothetical protein
MTPEQKAAESAKYLKADVPSIGQPTWNYWDGSGRYANITGADGKEYMFVPDDYVKKGLIQDDIQFYNKQFLDPATFKNSVQYSLPKGMQSVVNSNGYVWSIDDYNKLGLSSSNGYRIGPNDPPILGVGYPQQSLGQGNVISYITQPTLAPGLGGQQRVQQDFITTGGGRQVGYGSYSYYQNNDDFSKAFRGALQGLGPLTPILLDIFAGPGTGAIYSMSKAAGEASMTGDWNKAATTIGTIMAAPYVSGAVAGAVGSALDMGTLANSIIGNAVGNAAVAGLTGGDPVAAMVNSGVGGAVNSIIGKIEGFSELPPSVQKVFNATLRAELTGKDPSKAAILAATTSGLQAIKNGMDVNDRIQKNYSREATPEELNNFAYVSTPEELNSSFDKYMQSVANPSANQAAIDEQNRLDAEAKQKADDEAERLRQAGLLENKNPLPTDPTTPPVTDPTTPPVTDPTTPPVTPPVTDPNKPLDGADAYKYDPATGNYTFTDDDGSTLTIDKDANPIGFTEATDTSWSKLTDAKTGNLRLPNLPSGKTPSVKAPVQRPSTTTPTTPTTAPTTQPDFLSSILGQQQQTPVTYQTVMPELAKVFYGGKDFSSTPQRLNAQGQLVQDNQLLPGSDSAQPTSALAPQSNPRENGVTSMLTRILGGGGDSVSQEELLKILGRG